MKNTPIATYVLLALNFLAFAALAGQQKSLLNTGADALAILQAGANFNPLTLGGEPWRLVTSMFLHFGIVHLIVNMYALFNLGRYLEPAIGTVRFVIVYFICGVAAGLASLIFNVYANSAGASGALFGLFGYQLAASLIGTADDKEQRRNVLINFFIFLVINTIITLSASVDLVGHIGGCVAGIAIAVLHFKLRWLIDNRYLAIVLVVLPFTLVVLPKGQMLYYRIFQEVLDTEEKTDMLQRNYESDQVLADSLHPIAERWHNIQASIRSLPRLPASLRHDTAELRFYAQLREQLTRYNIMLVERQSLVYMDSVDIIRAKLDSIAPLDLRYPLNFRVRAEPAAPDSASSPGVRLRPKKIFYDSAWKEIDDPNVAVYYRDGYVDSADRWQGAVTDHFRNGDIQMKGAYRDGMKHGAFIYYTDRHTYSSAGRYEREEAVGKWENFHWNGALESEVFYAGDAYTRAVFDSLGHAQVVNGEGKVMRYYPSGQLREEGYYTRGRREGDWLGYHPDGKPYYKEMYRDNRIIRGVSVDRSGKRYVYDQLSIYPFPVSGMPAFQKYVLQNVRHPDDGSSGVVKVIFNVGVDGAMWDYVVIQSVSPACDREAIRVIKEGPAWRPGVLHGHVKLPSQGYAEIAF